MIYWYIKRPEASFGTPGVTCYSYGVVAGRGSRSQCERTQTANNEPQQQNTALRGSQRASLNYTTTTSDAVGNEVHRIEKAAYRVRNSVEPLPQDFTRVGHLKKHKAMLSSSKIGRRILHLPPARERFGRVMVGSKRHMLGRSVIAHDHFTHTHNSIAPLLLLLCARTGRRLVDSLPSNSSTPRKTTGCFITK